MGDLSESVWITPVFTSNPCGRHWLRAVHGTWTLWLLASDFGLILKHQAANRYVVGKIFCQPELHHVKAQLSLFKKKIITEPPPIREEWKHLPISQNGKKYMPNIQSAKRGPTDRAMFGTTCRVMCRSVYSHGNSFLWGETQYKYMHAEPSKPEHQTGEHAQCAHGQNAQASIHTCIQAARDEQMQYAQDPHRQQSPREDAYRTAGFDEISSGQTPQVGAEIGAGFRNIGAETGKSGAEVIKLTQK